MTWRDYLHFALEIYKLICAGLITLWLIALFIMYGCWKEWWWF